MVGPYVTDKHFISVKEASQIFFCGRVTTAMIYKLANEGKIPVIRVGRRILVDAEKMEQMYA